MEQDICLIGGSPSSGSSLLVALLGKRAGIIAVPETGLFSHGRDLVDGLTRADVSDGEVDANWHPPWLYTDAKDDLSWYLPWLNTDVKVVHALGWPENTYGAARAAYSDPFELLRSKIDPARTSWLIEKTPENIFAFKRFLEASPMRRVVVTSRDALSVTQSLARRGFSISEALLAWFTHSYVTVQLLRAFPNQVFHCQYDRLTKKPDAMVDDIIAFWGIKEPPSASVDTNVATSQPGDAEDRNDGNNVRFLTDFSNWSLSGTSWSRSPSDQVESTPPTNLIGLAYDVILDRLAFKTPKDGLVSPRTIDQILRSGHIGELAVPQPDRYQPTQLIGSLADSTYIRCLAKFCPPYAAGA